MFNMHASILTDDMLSENLPENELLFWEELAFLVDSIEDMITLEDARDLLMDLD